VDLPRHGATRNEAQLGQNRKSFPEPFIQMTTR